MKHHMIIGGVKYVHSSQFAEEVGVKVPTVYQWRSEGKLPFAIRYLGKLYIEEKAIEPFKKSLVEKVVVYR